MPPKLFALWIYLTVMSGTISCVAQNSWTRLDAPSYKGKQDDIYFIDQLQGWYVNGAGKIYKTRNGGSTWSLIFEKPGTFFRSIAFIDSLKGYAGNIGTDYFPNVEDSIPLYQTIDGGKSWDPVLYSGPRVKGICAIDIVKSPYVNHGVLDYKYSIRAGGRVGNPAFLITSTDDGRSFKSEDLNSICAYILDIKFFNESEGYLFAGSNKAIDKSHALVLKTKDGGKSWKKVYESSRPYEITWKASFPSRKVGYVTIQSYNPDSTVRKRFVIKTKNAGAKWKEHIVTEDYKCRPFGIGFVNEKKGWIGSSTGGFETLNGGKTWAKANLGNYVNKIRIIESDESYVVYAIGSNVYKLVAPKNNN